MSRYDMSQGGRIGSAAVAIVACVAAVRLMGAPVNGPTKIAYVSVNKIAALTPAAQASAKKLQQLRDDRARAIAAKQKELETAKLELARSGGVFQGSKREQLRKDEARLVGEMQKMQADAQGELQKLQHDLQVEFQTQLSGILAVLTKQRGTEIVLNQDASVVYSAPGMDWTDEVIERLKAQQAPPPPAKK